MRVGRRDGSVKVVVARAVLFIRKMEGDGTSGSGKMLVLMK